MTTLRKVCFLLSTLSISGGLYVILQHALHMRRKGIDVTLATPAAVGDSAEWHRAFRELPCSSVEELADQRFDLAVATWWESVYDLPRIRSATYAYFVQNADFLLSAPALRERAERTYSFGLPAITVSESLADVLTERYGMQTAVALNGIDKQIFRRAGPAFAPRVNGRLRVLVEGPFGARTKGVAHAITLARQSRADEIWLLTSSPVNWYPGVARVFSGLDAEGCAGVYRSCDVLLKLSTLESCSLPILEMMHCGGMAITYDIPAPNEYLVNGRNSLLLPIDQDRAAVAAIDVLKRAPTLLQWTTEGAKATAATWPNWEESSDAFLQHCRSIAIGPTVTRAALQAAIDTPVEPAARPGAVEMVREGLKSAVKPMIARSRRLQEIKTIARALLLERGAPPRAEIWGA